MRFAHFYRSLQLMGGFRLIVTGHFFRHYTWGRALFCRFIRHQTRRLPTIATVLTGVVRYVIDDKRRMVTIFARIMTSTGARNGQRKFVIGRCQLTSRVP